MSTCTYKPRANLAHSDDRVQVFHGRREPITLCGFHASPVWLGDVITWVSTRVATPPPIPDDPFAPYDPDEAPVCIHCGVPVVLDYDGRGTGWSHLYPDLREGMRECFLKEPT